MAQADAITAGNRHGIIGLDVYSLIAHCLETLLAAPFQSGITLCGALLLLYYCSSYLSWLGCDMGSPFTLLTTPVPINGKLTEGRFSRLIDIIQAPTSGASLKSTQPSVWHLKLCTWIEHSQNGQACLSLHGHFSP